MKPTEEYTLSILKFFKSFLESWELLSQNITLYSLRQEQTTLQFNSKSADKKASLCSSSGQNCVHFQGQLKPVGGKKLSQCLDEKYMTLGKVLSLQWLSFLSYKIKRDHLGFMDQYIKGRGETANFFFSQDIKSNCPLIS